MKVSELIVYVTEFSAIYYQFKARNNLFAKVSPLRYHPFYLVLHVVEF
jgi:hypothetical protein